MIVVMPLACMAAFAIGLVVAFIIGGTVTVDWGRENKLICDARAKVVTEAITLVYDTDNNPANYDKVIAFEVLHDAVVSYEHYLELSKKLGK